MSSEMGIDPFQGRLPNLDLCESRGWISCKVELLLKNGPKGRMSNLYLCKVEVVVIYNLEICVFLIARSR